MQLNVAHDFALAIVVAFFASHFLFIQHFHEKTVAWNQNLIQKSNSLIILICFPVAMNTLLDISSFFCAFLTIENLFAGKAHLRIMHQIVTQSTFEAVLNRLCIICRQCLIYHNFHRFIYCIIDQITVDCFIICHLSNIHHFFQINFFLLNHNPSNRFK